MRTKSSDQILNALNYSRLAVPHDFQSFVIQISIFLLFTNYTVHKHDKSLSNIQYFIRYIIIRIYGRVQILPQKVFEGEFIHVIAYAENLNFTTYSSNEFSVQIRWNTWSHVKTQILPHRKLNFTTLWVIDWLWSEKMW